MLLNLQDPHLDKSRISVGPHANTGHPATHKKAQHSVASQELFEDRVMSKWQIIAKLTKNHIKKLVNTLPIY